MNRFALLIWFLLFLALPATLILARGPDSTPDPRGDDFGCGLVCQETIRDSEYEFWNHEPDHYRP